MQLALDASIANVQPAERTASELDDLDTLVRTYRPRLLRFVAFSLGDADLAESITQDCFLKAYNARDRFRGDCSISTWLTSIAVNLIRDQQRLQKFRFWRQARATAIDVTDAANFLPSHESSPESRLLVKEKASQVYAALQNLSPNQRTVFLMRFAEDLELSEIAAITKIPVNTVKTHLHRALKSVRTQVRGAQVATPEQALAAGPTRPEESAVSAPRSRIKPGHAKQPTLPENLHEPQSGSLF
jgi:RNA polymerase sigma-70 factor (ECF subfamily)